jgi:cob(I)alamin adenosyltransferase
MKLYTRKGDRGQTAILGGGRRSKSDCRIQALGAIDEVNAALGLILASASPPAGIDTHIFRMQSNLLEVGAALASLDPATSSEHFVAETRVLEETIDWAQDQLPPLTRFIIPGGGTAGAGLHWARTLARRAETMVVAALQDEIRQVEPVGPSREAAGGAESSEEAAPRLLPGRSALLMWINRLSDALFALARLANFLDGKTETIWEPVSRKRG